MKWENKRRSSNVEDRRGQSPKRSRSGGINPMLIAPLFRFFFSKKGLIIAGVLVVVSLVTNINPLNFIGQLFLGAPIGTERSQGTYKSTKEENQSPLFCQTILASTEDVWNQKIENYREPTLVLFTNSVESACGMASSATGPFYCPGDEKLYIDLSFFDISKYPETRFDDILKNTENVSTPISRRSGSTKLKYRSCKFSNALPTPSSKEMKRPIVVNSSLKNIPSK